MHAQRSAVGQSAAHAHTHKHTHKHDLGKGTTYTRHYIRGLDCVMQRRRGGGEGRERSSVGHAYGKVERDFVVLLPTHTIYQHIYPTEKEQRNRKEERDRHQWKQ